MKIVNETTYATREVNSIVRWVLRHLEVDKSSVCVRIKHHNGGHGYQGRFYPRASSQSAEVYSWDRDDWVEIRPNAEGQLHLIVCRIGKPGVYPRLAHTYKRKGDMPEPWMLEDWREALVSITAHEAMHLRQWNQRAQRRAGRRRFQFREDECEWAAFRLLRDWKEERA